MEKKFAVKYLRAVELDVEYVSRAVDSGAFLTLEEWHDFVFKCQVAGSKYDALARFESACHDYAEVARIEAYILECILDVQLLGFTNVKAKKCVKAITKRFNKLLGLMEHLRFTVSDMDGIVSFSVESYDYANKVERKIRSRESLCCFLREIWEMGIKELRMFNKDTIRFLVEHLDNEVKTIQVGKRPSPYLGGAKFNTLTEVLFKRTDYETAKKSPIASVKKAESQKQEVQLKVAK